MDSPDACPRSPRLSFSPESELMASVGRMGKLNPDRFTLYSGVWAVYLGAVCLYEVVQGEWGVLKGLGMFAGGFLVGALFLLWIMF